MSTIKKQPANNPRGASNRSESDQPRDLRILSPSPDVKEYFQYTRNFPSSNPIKSARPDLLSFVERIPMTQNPGGPNLQNRRELLKKSQRGEIDPDKENIENHLLAEIDRLNEELKSKDDEIRKLKNRNQELEKMSNDLKASVHSFTGTPMKEKDAKDLAKRFAKERLQAEIDAEEWKTRYKNLEKRLKDMEMAEPREVIVKKEKEVPKDNSKELQQFQQKVLDLESKVLSLTNENDKLKSMMKERNTEIDNLKVRVGSKDREIDELKTEIRKLGDKSPLDSKIKDLTGQIEIWRNKANLLEEQWDKEQKRSKDLQDSRDKYENDLKNVKNDLDQAKKLLAKLENTNQELEKLKLETESYKRKLEEFDALRKRLDESDARNKGLTIEIEALKQKLGLSEEKERTHEKDIEVWRRRCDDIEKEWGEKHKRLEFELDELGLMNGNLKETEEHIASLQAENENWKSKCLEIEAEWNEKHGKVLQQLEQLKASSKDPQDSQSLLVTVLLLMLEVERLNVLIKLLETERENEKVAVRASRTETEKKAVNNTDSTRLQQLNEELAIKTRLLKAKEQELEEQARRFESLRNSQTNPEYLKQRILELERQVAKLEVPGAETAMLRERLRRSEEENEKLREGVRKSQYERSEGEMSRWKGLYESVSKDLEALQRKYFEETQKKSNNFEMENKLVMMATENERLARDNEQLKAKYLEEINKKKDDFQSEARIKYLNNEVERLENENREFKQKYYQEMSRSSGNVELETKVKYLSSEVERLTADNTRKSQSLDLEGRVRYLTAEVERLSGENNEIRSKYLEEMSKKSQGEDLDIRVKYLTGEVTRFSNENAEWKEKYYQEMAKKNQSSDLEVRVKYLQAEIERLTSDNSDLKQRYSEEVNRKSNNFELENKVVLLVSELQHVKQDLDYSRRTIQDLEAEKRRLNEQIDEKVRKVHEETSKRSQMQSNYIEQDLKEKNTRLTTELEDYKTKYARLEVEYRKSVEAASTNSNELMSLEYELEMKGKKLKEYELLLQEKTSSTSMQNDQLVRENERIRIELDELKRKYSLFELETYKKGNIESENQRKVALLQAEIDRISQHYSDKVKENKNLLEVNLQKAQDAEETLIKLRITENQMPVLDSKIKGLIEEIDAWRIRYENLERFKAKEMEDLKMHSEAIRKSQLDREIRDLTIKSQNERNRLEAEIKRLQGLIEIQSGEMALLKGKNVDNNRLGKLEESLFLMSGENERLNIQVQTLNEKLRDVETQKMRLSEFYQEQQRSSIESTKKSTVFQLEGLQAELAATKRELDDWKTKARKSELENYGSASLNQQVNELRQQVLSLNRDQQGLVDTLNEKKTYIEKLRQKKKVLKEKLRGSLTLEQNSQVLLREIDAVKTENMHMKEELERLNQRNYYQPSQIDSYSLQMKQEELNRLSLRLQSVERDLDSRVNELKEWQSKYYQAKAETADQNELNELRKRCAILEYENSNQRVEITKVEEVVHQEKQKKAFASEGEDKQKKINTLTEELERWKERCRELENSSADKRFLEKNIKDWEQRVNALLSDNEKLTREKALLEQNIFELSNHRDDGIDKFKLQQLEERRLHEIEELHEQLEILRSVHFDSRGVEFEAERLAYETALTQMKNKIMDLENTGALIMREGEDNKMILALKLKELEDSRNRVRVYEEKGAFNGFLGSDESEKLRRQISDMKETIMKLENDKKGLQMQVDQAGFTVRNLQSELERTAALLEGRKREMNDALKHIEELRNENQNLTLNTRGSFGSSEIYVYEEKNRELLRKIQELENAKEFYRAQAERNCMDLTSKNMELIEKIQELENLKTKYQDSLNNLQRLEAKLLEKLQQEEILIA